MKKTGPDIEGVAECELIFTFHQLGQGRALMTATVNLYTRE
jgi:hypothetical protein